MAKEKSELKPQYTQAIEKYKEAFKGKKLYLNPISEQDLKIVLSLQRLLELAGVDVSRIMSNFKIYSDKEISESLARVEEEFKLMQKERSEESRQKGDQSRPANRIYVFSDRDSTSFALRNYISARIFAENGKFGIVLNPSVNETPFTNIKIFYDVFETLEDDYQEFLESIE